MKFFPITHYESLMSSAYGESINELFTRMGPIGTNVSYLTFTQLLVDTLTAAPDNLVGMQMLNHMMRDQESINLMGNMLYHCWQMRNHGEKIYYVSKSLCHRLIHTNVNVSCRYLKAPFEEIYVFIDQDEIVIDDVIDKTTRPMRGMYLGLKTEPDGKVRMRIMTSSGGAGLETQSDINYHYVLTIPDEDATIDDAVCGMMDDLASGKITAFSLTDTNRTLIASSFKLAVNILLYITSNNADLFPFKPQRLADAAGNKKNPSKAKRLLAKSGHCAQYPFIKVGYNLPELERGAYVHTSKGHITCMFDVSGHWRWQWRGPREAPTRLHIWIAPYIKGRGFIEGFHKNYIIAGGDDGE